MSVAKLRASDALFDAAGGLVGLIAARDDGGARVLVSARLPCGECPRCRRALTALCPRAVELPAGLGGAALELPDRFLAPIDEAGAPPTSAPAALAAFPVARLLDAGGRIGVGAGDLVVAIGAGALATAAAASFAARGARSFLAAPRATAPDVPPGVALLALEAPRDEWSAALEPRDAPTTGGWQERKLFLTDDDRGSLSAALELLADGGGALALLASPPVVELHAVRLPLARVLVHAGAHPDFLPEALAAIARGEVAHEWLVLADETLDAGGVRGFRLRP